MTVHGFHGRLLHVDLDSGRHQWREIGADRLRAFVGGIGLGTSLLYDFAPPGVEPLAPENPLVFASAPLAGTGLTTTAKYAVVTKSPLTGFIADSLSSSFFALALKAVGVDALVVTGRAPEPVCLFVGDGGVELRDARHLWGKSAADTENAVSAELEGVAVRVAAVGPAGENLVRFATISNEGRHAGRGGVGAVMGSKNLKAIALCGGKQVAVADPEGVAAAAASLRRRSLGTHTAKYREVGTVANLAVFDRLGALPARNFRQPTFDAADELSGESLTETSFSRRNGCASCTIRCERLFKASSGGEQRMEYETLFALGPLCGLEDREAVLEAARLCDAYGLDSISTGGTLAWAMECAERGLLPEAGGLRFGAAEAVLDAIPAIAERRGVGDLLAEGSRRAALALGRGSLDWAMQVKGLELPGYEPRSLKTMALGLAVSPRGACHNRSGAYEADFSGKVDRLDSAPPRGALVAASEDFAAALDSLIVCKFLRNCFQDFYAEAADLLAKVTGWDYSAAELRLAAERIHTLKRCFNEREGWRPEDDGLPPRVLTESLAAGVARGTRLTRDELREMLRDYYNAREWDEDGRVSEAKRKALGLPAKQAVSKLHPREATAPEIVIPAKAGIQAG